MPNPADTLTLRDLENWNRRDERGNFLPSLAVLGHPVAHSVSPQMHNAALAELAKKHPALKDWCYFKFDIEPQELEAALKLLNANNFKGTNLTVPHKNAWPTIMALNAQKISGGVRSELAGKLKEMDKYFMHPINTLLFFNMQSALWSEYVERRQPKTLPPEERIIAHNTDGYGLTQALKRDLQVTVKGKTVVILGAGGAAAEASSECLNQKCAVLWVGSRDADKRAKLCEYLKNTQNISRAIPSKFNPPEPRIEITGFDIADASVAKSWPEDVVLINATTLGMKRDDPLPFDVSLLGRYACIFDMVYNRQGPTKFVEAARARDLRAADGFGMLVWQGAKSLSLWIKGQEGIDIKPEDVAQTMMNAACAPLGLPPRHA